MKLRSLPVLGVLTTISLGLVSACVPVTEPDAGRDIPDSGNSVSAMSIGMHYVEITFGGQVPDELVDPTMYTAVSTDGNALAIVDAERDALGNRVYLTTSPQQTVNYELTIRQITGGGDNAAPDDHAGTSVIFSGNTSQEPFLASAIALSSQEILLTFSRVMLEGIEDTSFYEIEPPLELAQAERGLDRFTVRLHLAPEESMEHRAYQVRVGNLFASTDLFLFDPMRNTATFHPG